MRSLRLDARGDLHIHTGAGEIRQHRPLVYQETAEGRREVAARYRLTGRTQVGFQLGSYDASLPLVIDPVLNYGTYLGGMAADVITEMAVDAAGNAYLTGFTFSPNFPTTAGSFQTAHDDCTHGDCRDVFVSKLNPQGTALVYSTFLRGNAEDTGVGIRVDAEGNAYLVGFSYSPDFPSTAGTINTGGNVFVAKLSASGDRLIFSGHPTGSARYLSLALDSAHNVYLAGLGNGGHFGIYVLDGSVDVKVQGNQIGTDGSGAADLGNAQAGVYIDQSSSGNTTGGVEVGAGNRIAHNGGDGILVGDGIGNAVLGNSTYANRELGIDLGPGGVTPNDALDADGGPNRLQNFPVITSTTGSGGTTTVSETLDSAPGAQYRVEFFANAELDPSGHGEGQTFLASTDVTTDAGGHVFFSVAVPASAGTLVSATATDASGNTSEFSNADAEAPTLNLPTDIFADATGPTALRSTSRPTRLTTPGSPSRSLARRPPAARSPTARTPCAAPRPTRAATLPRAASSSRSAGAHRRPCPRTTPT